MRTSFKLSSLAVAVAAASGCASVDGSAPWRVVGQQSVRHAGSATDADAQYALGKYYLGQNRAALALIAFTRAIEYDSRSADAYNGRATALVQLGDLERAAEDVARAIELSPRSAHLLNNQGFIRIQQRDFEGAAASLRAAFEIEPRNERVVANWRLLASRVSHDSALARRLEAPAGERHPGLAQLPAPEPTRPVVEALSGALSGPVINLEYPSRVAEGSPASPSATLSQADPAAGVARPTLSVSTPGRPATTIVDLSEARQSAPATTSATVVTIGAAGEASTPSASGVGGNTAPEFAPARVSVVDIPAAPALASGPAPTLASIAVEPAVPPAAAEPTRVVDVAAHDEAAASPASAPPVAPAPPAAPATIATPSPPAAPAANASVPAPVARGAVVDVASVMRGARIEVANGNGVRGMAADVGTQLRRHSYKVVRVSNANHFGYSRTRIYFRDGYLPAALQLAREMPVRPAILLSNRIAARSDLQVVVGRDLARREVATAPAGATLDAAPDAS